MKMVTGDDKTIATEMARVLGMRTPIEGPQGLPVLVVPPQIDHRLLFGLPTVRMPLHFRKAPSRFSLVLSVDQRRLSIMLCRQVLDADGNAPTNLAESHGALIVPASGFAQVEFDICVYKPV
jgi:hypothetical protein